MAETQKATVVFGVLNETSQDETRVALTPDIVTRLKKAGVSCLVQSGAGIAAQYTDDDYAKAGAEVVAADDVIAPTCSDSWTVRLPRRSRGSRPARG